MNDELIVNAALSVISLLFMATLVAFFLRKSKIPYTVVLVLVGLAVGLLSKQWGLFEFMADFRLSPELVFYVFLPTLIFESALNMKFSQFTRNIRAITLLSTLGMVISMLLVAVGMHEFLGFSWPSAFLFGALISATDPVSVLSLFKKVGAPKRLTTIVEGESLFNDGMALVLFGILLEGNHEVLGSFRDFGEVVFGGLVVGVIMGVIFSKALDYVKNSKEIEISLTLILAHFTFILAEYFLGVSGILATVAAGIVIGNYGAYKISPSVKEIMNHFWDYSAFLANSLLFLMVGLVIASATEDVLILLPALLIAIVITLVARMLMVYTLLPLNNFFFPKEKVPLAWMHVIQWSGLRGALAIALILTLPESYPFYQEILIFTVGIIFFSIIFNGFTIGPLLSMLKLQSLSTTEAFEHEESLVLIDQKVQKKMEAMLKKGFISKAIFNEISQKYKEHCEACNQHIEDLFRFKRNELSPKELKRLLKRHLLGIEKTSFKTLYYQGEITQELLNILLNNVQLQMEMVDTKEVVRVGQLTFLSPNAPLTRLLEKVGFKGLGKRIRRRQIMLRYEMYRARLISTANVLETLGDIQKSKTFPEQSVVAHFTKKYSLWNKKAGVKLKALEKEDPQACHDIQIFLAQQAAFRVENKVLKELESTGITSAKVYNQLKKELEDRQEASVL